MKTGSGAETKSERVDELLMDEFRADEVLDVDEYARVWHAFWKLTDEELALVRVMATRWNARLAAAEGGRP